MNPNPAFVRKLRAYDPDLRVIWSAHKECWLIERRIRRGRPLAYADSPDPDVVRRVRDGYIHVGNVPPRGLDELVLLNLWKQDMWQQGGAKVVNAVLDDYWETKDRKDDRNQRDDLKQVAADVWDRIAWLRRGRISVPEAIHA